MRGWRRAAREAVPERDRGGQRGRSAGCVPNVARRLVAANGERGAAIKVAPRGMPADSPCGEGRLPAGSQPNAPLVPSAVPRWRIRGPEVVRSRPEVAHSPVALYVASPQDSSSRLDGGLPLVSSPGQIGHEFGRALAALDKRRRVIALRRTYAEKPVRLAVLGKEFGVSRERTRQLEVNLLQRVEPSTGELLGQAARWLRSVVGPVAPLDVFAGAMEEVVGDAPPRWRTAAEVALVRAAGYQIMDGVVGDASFREFVDEVRQRARMFSDRVGLIDEEGLRAAISAPPVPRWDAAVHNAGLIRVRGRLALRDTRRARVALALEEARRPLLRQEIAELANLADNTTLASLLSSDKTFVRLTKDAWGLASWTREPYRGVVSEVVKRLERAGGRIEVEALVEELPEQYGVLPATVRNYLSTRKFVVKDGFVSIAPRPRVSTQPLEEARDVMWTPDGKPVLRFPAGEQHLRGNSQKISMAVAQHLGVGLDQSRRVPFAYPRGVDAASVIWRSFDPNGPEMGRVREALQRADVRPGDDVLVLLNRRRLRLLDPWTVLLDEKPS